MVLVRIPGSNRQRCTGQININQWKLKYGWNTYKHRQQVLREHILAETIHTKEVATHFPF